MTLAPDREESQDDPELAEPTPDVVRRVVRQRTVARRRRRQRLLIAQSVLTVVFVASLVGLGYVGFRASLGITGGTGERIEDPAAPGYVAEVLPTSVTLVAFYYAPYGPVEPPPGRSADEVPGDAGRALLSALMVVQRTGGQPATVTPIPAHTMLWQFEDSPPETVGAVYGSGGTDVLALRLGASLSFGSTEVLTLPAQSLRALAEAAGPITIDLPDDIVGPSAEDPEVFDVRYSHGPLTLEPADVPDFMVFQGVQEPASNFALRLDLVWRALLDQLEPGDIVDLDPLDMATDDAERFSEVLGEATRSQPQVAAVPYATGPDGQHDRSAEGIDTSAMPPWVAEHVPFPVSAFPGQRAKVDLLNGTENPDVLRTVAPVIVEANGEISRSGNAESFDLASSRVEFARPEARPAAERIAGALGLTAQERPDLVTDGDVVVVVGSDQL